MSFSQLRFDHYARELSLAVYDLSLESRESAFLALKNDFRNAVQSKSSRQTMSDMSIEALKQRFVAIPGIENLTMRQEGGKQVFSLGGPFVEVNMNATELEIETALMSIVDQNVPSRLPLVNITETVSTPPVAKPSSFQPGSISAIFQALRNERAKLIEDIQSTATEFGPIMQAGRQLHQGMKTELEELKAEFHGLTNFPTSQ